MVVVCLTFFLYCGQNSPRSSQQTRITSQSDMEVVTPLLVDRPSSSVRQKFSSTSGSSSAASSVPSPTRTVPNVSSDNTDVEMNALPASDWQMPPQISFDEDGYLEPKSNNSNGYLVVLPGTRYFMLLLYLMLDFRSSTICLLEVAFHLSCNVLLRRPCFVQSSIASTCVS